MTMMVVIIAMRNMLKHRLSAQDRATLYTSRKYQDMYEFARCLNCYQETRSYCHDKIYMQLWKIMRTIFHSHQIYYIGQELPNFVQKYKILQSTLCSVAEPIILLKTKICIFL